MQPQRRIGFITALLVLAGWAVQAPPVQAATATFGAADDASVFESSPTGNFGFASTVESDGSPRSQALLRFEIGTFSEPVRSATLRLYVTGSSSNGPEVWPTSAAWDEGSVTWADRPSRQGSSALADLASVSSGRWVDLPVTSHVAVAVGAGTEAVSFVLVADSSDGFDVRSAEASSNRPQLVVETGEEEPPPPPPPSEDGHFAAGDDASVFESSPTGNFGSAVTLESDSSPRSQALLRFEIGTFSEPVRSATLRLYVTGSSSNGPEVWPTSA
ncbi:MAG TPA: DNRLRE domain-containing protein, partial [Acidimicrobiia bacterium]|nr:DNRLRE domain-containing protein [Acidimicrobiia bacterium]